MQIMIFRRAAIACTAILVAAASNAQELIPADPDPTRLANGQQAGRAESDWQIQVGVGALYGPAFLGSKDYQLRAGPNIEVRYKDRFFFSVIDGLGFDLLQTDHVRAGPIVKIQQKRRQSGKTMFVIAGDRTDALLGLGDVSLTAEAGGYVEYSSGGFAAKIEVRKGIGGHDGVIAELGARYTTELMGLKIDDRSVILSVGPRAALVDDKYNQSYFGIDAGQSARSGLARFDAKAGLLSYGAGGAVVIPLTSNLRAAWMFGFDRLAGDAGKSPLVRDRGSRNQATVGLGLTYRFGL
jgi:outer membrane protein